MSWEQWMILMHEELIKKPMPTLGGLGIFVTFNIGTFVLLREQFPTHEAFAVLLASSVIILTGMIDDILVLKPRQKKCLVFLLQHSLYIFLAGIRMNVLNLPFIKNEINLGWWSFPITIFLDPGFD